MLEGIVAKKITDLLTLAIDKLFKKSTLRANEKEAGILISEAIRELLTGSPNLNRVRNKLQRAENASTAPSEELLRAREILRTVEDSQEITGLLPGGSGWSTRSKSKTVPGKKSKKKAAKKKTSTKSTKKRSKKKSPGRAAKKKR